MPYEVRFYKGDYTARQNQANKDKCIAYVEHHFNSSPSPNSNYVVIVTGSNASDASKNWGRWYAQEVAKKFGLPMGGTEGLLVGGFNGRGDGNVKYTNMPAILLEPLFVSNPAGALIAKSDTGQADLAMILAKSIQKSFPQGGIVGFSVGHKYKTSRPSDLGAAVYGGGWEAELAEKVMLKAKELLENPALMEPAAPKKEAVPQAPAKRELRVVQNGQVLWCHTFEGEEKFKWDGNSKKLEIYLTVDEDDYIDMDGSDAIVITVKG